MVEGKFKGHQLFLWAEASFETKAGSRERLEWFGCLAVSTRGQSNPQKNYPPISPSPAPISPTPPPPRQKEHKAGHVNGRSNRRPFEIVLQVALSIYNYFQKHTGGIPSPLSFVCYLFVYILIDEFIYVFPFLNFIIIYFMFFFLGGGEHDNLFFDPLLDTQPLLRPRGLFLRIRVGAKGCFGAYGVGALWGSF